MHVLVAFQSEATAGTWAADKCTARVDALVRVMEHVGEGRWRPGMTSPPCPEP